MKFTFDTDVLAEASVVAKVSKRKLDIAIVSVTGRESGSTRFMTTLKSIDGLEIIPETMIWGESKWGESKLGSQESSERLEKILFVIASGSFPKDRSSLSERQTRQLRDAMIFQAHVKAGRDMFISNDRKAYINHGKRDKLENIFQTRVMDVSEFSAYLDKIC